MRLISGYHGIYLVKQTEFSEFYQEAFVTCYHLVKRKQTRNSLFFMVSSLSDINSCFWHMHSGVVMFMTFAIVQFKILACSFESLVGFY